MKKLLVLLALALFVGGLAAAETIESPMYAKTVPIYKITSHELGYKVTYFTDLGDLKTIYIPIEWFYQVGQYRNADGFVKAEMYKGAGGAYPYLQIFWKDGKFHHFRLFVVKDYNDKSWAWSTRPRTWPPSSTPARP